MIAIILIYITNRKLELCTNGAATDNVSEHDRHKLMRNLPDAESRNYVTIAQFIIQRRMQEKSAVPDF